jgi:hypothetical protein
MDCKGYIMSNSITDRVEITVPAAGDFLISETTGKVAHKSKYSNIKADMLANAQANISVTNNNRIFYATFLITDATAVAGTMIVGAVFNGATLVAGNIVLRNATTDKVNNGLWTIQTTGSAVRYVNANSGFGLGRSLTHIRYNGGINTAGQWYYCTTHEPNVGTDSVDFERVYLPNQSLSTTDSPNFAGITIDGVGIYSESDNIEINYGLYRRLVIDEFKNLSDKQDKVADVSDTEIGYLNGVTSNIQGQLGELYNAIPTKADIASPAFTGYVEVPNLRISPSPYGSYNPTYDLLLESYHSTPIETSSGTYAKGYLYGRSGFVFDNILGTTRLGTTKIGTSTNYTEFEADGTLKFNGTATCYLDAVVPFCYKGGTGEANFDTFVGGIKNLKFLVGDFVAFQNTEAPHDYKEGSEIEIHLHWAVNQAMIAGDKVKWKLELAFANPINGVNTGTIFCDPATPTVFGTKTIEIEYTSPVGGTPAGSYIYSTFGTISAANMANVKIGAGFIGTLTRIAKSAGGTDPATGCVYGLNLGIHYEVDTIGSRQRGTK